MIVEAMNVKQIPVGELKVGNILITKLKRHIYPILETWIDTPFIMVVKDTEPEYDVEMSRVNKIEIMDSYYKYRIHLASGETIKVSTYQPILIKGKRTRRKKGVYIEYVYQS